MLSLTGARSRSLLRCVRPRPSQADLASVAHPSLSSFHSSASASASASSSSSSSSTTPSSPSPSPPSASTSSGSTAEAGSKPEPRRPARWRPKEVIEAEKAAKLARQAERAKVAEQRKRAQYSETALIKRGLRRHQKEAQRVAQEPPSSTSPSPDENPSSRKALPGKAARLDDHEAYEMMQFPHLPPRDEWRTAFPSLKAGYTAHRYFVANRDTVQRLLNGLQIGVSRNEAGRKVTTKTTVIEAYPGPGTLTSELVRLPQVEKVIALEQAPVYQRSLEALHRQLAEGDDPSLANKLQVFHGSAYDWNTYNRLISQGLLGHLQGRVPLDETSTVDFCNNAVVPVGHHDPSWQAESPIFYLAQLPNTVHGEQLFAQIVHAIASRLWLFRFGRIRLGLICGESLAKRCTGQPGDRNNRGKLGTTVQCLADVEIHLDPHRLSPHHHHFFPGSQSIGPRVPVTGVAVIPNSNPSTGFAKTGMCAMTVTPKRAPLIGQRDIEAFEFVTRNLFVLRSKPVAEAMAHIAPGGQNVLKMLARERADQGLIRPDECIDPETKVVDLTNVQWAQLARTFDKWPFRPEHLFEVGRITGSKGQSR